MAEEKEKRKKTKKFLDFKIENKISLLYSNFKVNQVPHMPLLALKLKSNQPAPNR